MRNKLIPLLMMSTFLTGCNLSKWEDISQARALEIINNIGTYYSKHQPHHLISYTVELRTETNLDTEDFMIHKFDVGLHQYDIDRQIDSKIKATFIGGLNFDLSFVLISDNSLYKISINNRGNYTINVPLLNSDQDTIKEYFHEQIFPGINPCNYFVNLINSLDNANLYHELSPYSQEGVIDGTNTFSSKNNQSLKANTEYYSSIRIEEPEKMLDIKPNRSECTLTFDNDRCLGYSQTTTIPDYEYNLITTNSIDCIFDYDTPVGFITTDYFSQITDKESITNITKTIDEKLANLFQKR